MEEIDRRTYIFLSEIIYLCNGKINGQTQISRLMKLTDTLPLLNRY